jgi:hypothetical protein
MFTYGMGVIQGSALDRAAPGSAGLASTSLGSGSLVQSRATEMARVGDQRIWPRRPAATLRIPCPLPLDGGNLIKGSPPTIILSDTENVQDWLCRSPTPTCRTIAFTTVNRRARNGFCFSFFEEILEV